MSECRSQAGPRVLFVDQSGELGGAELSLLDIAERFRDRGRVVLFDEGPFAERLRTAGLAVEVLNAGSNLGRVGKHSGVWAQMRSAPALAGLVGRVVRRAREAELIHANTQKAFVVAAVAAFLARRPLVYHLRDILTPTHFSGANRRLITTLANRLAGRVIANSAATRDAFVQAGGQPSKVIVIHNAIDPEPFDAVSAAQARQHRLEFDGGQAPLIGVFGRLAPWKGQHVLIDALALLADDADHPGVHALLVGEALFGEHAYAERLRRQAADRGVGSRVHFLGFREDIPGLMKAVDIVVHCSVSPEPFGRVIVEAMLARRPVIASEAGGAVEIIHETEEATDSPPPGLLTPPDDAETLARAIDYLLSDPSAASAMADRGYQRARERFLRGPMLDCLEAELTRAAG